MLKKVAGQAGFVVRPGKMDGLAGFVVWRPGEVAGQAALKFGPRARV